jgi:serine/threonine protein kinase
MATTDQPKPSEAVPLDLLPVIRKSGVLTDRQFEEVRAKVLRGDYPIDSQALAERLVKEKLLTEYQARKILSNRPHGLVISRYVILERIGSGSMGRVYRAHHQLMGRTVALKIIAPEIASNQRVVARFQREMRLVGRLDHPNVIRAYDAEQIDSLLLIAMEYVPGQSLSHRLRTKGPLNPGEVVNYAAQAARGLGHAHAQGIVHRDVKPSNLLLSEDRQIKVLDLGLGVLMEADHQATFETADGVAVGTVDYMSPEQAMGRAVDGRSDLFSLGCAMYYLLTAQMPYPGDSAIERLGKRINQRPEPITKIRPDVPSRLVKVLDKLMANKPEDRFQTAEEAADALTALIKRKASSVARPAIGVEPPQVRTEPAPAAEDAATVVVQPSLPVPEPPPVYPAWFEPLASLAARSPWGALLALWALALVFLGAGFLLGLLIRAG